MEIPQTVWMWLDKWIPAERWQRKVGEEEALGLRGQGSTSSAESLLTGWSTYHLLFPSVIRLSTNWDEDVQLCPDCYRSACKTWRTTTGTSATKCTSRLRCRRSLKITQPAASCVSMTPWMFINAGLTQPTPQLQQDSHTWCHPLNPHQPSLALLTVSSC